MIALPHPQHAVESGGISAEGLISVTGLGDTEAGFDPSLFGGRVLRLAFDDIPVAAWTDGRNHSWTGPSEEQVAEALAFGRKVSAEAGPGARLAVHCLHGKSRSAALAVAINADALGPGREDEAVALLLRRGEANGPFCEEALSQLAVNPGIVRMADRALGRGDAIERALEAALPRFVTWRQYWRRQGCID